MCPSERAARRYFPVSSPLSSGKYGMKPIPSSHAAPQRRRRRRDQEAEAVLHGDERAAARAAKSAASSSAPRSKFERPMPRTLPRDQS